MKIGAFIIGMVIASLAAVIAGALADLGLWSCLALWVSVLVVSQLLYALIIAFLALGRGMKGRQDGANGGPAQRQDSAPGLSGEKITQK